MVKVKGDDGMFFWIEIYRSMIYSDYMRVKKILEDNKIDMKIKVNDLRGRMSGNVVAGGNPLILNSAGQNRMNQEYIVMVKRKDKDKACMLL